MPKDERRKRPDSTQTPQNPTKEEEEEEEEEEEGIMVKDEVVDE